MPLEKSKSKAAIAKNIRKLMDEGYPYKQAVAIVLNNSKRGK